MATKPFLATTAAAAVAAVERVRRRRGWYVCQPAEIATWQSELRRDIEIVCKIKTISSLFCHIGFYHGSTAETSLEDELLFFFVISEHYEQRVRLPLFDI